MRWHANPNCFTDAVMMNYVYHSTYKHRCHDRGWRTAAQVVAPSTCYATFDGTSNRLSSDASMGCCSYVHRVGRTGRAGNFGTAVTIFCPEESALEAELRQQLSAPLQQSGAHSISTLINLSLNPMKALLWTPVPASLPSCVARAAQSFGCQCHLKRLLFASF